MTLYDVDNRLEAIVDAGDGTGIDTETGEIITDEALDALHMEREEKLDNILCFIKNLEAGSKIYAEEAKNLKAMADAKKNKAESLKRYLAAHMAQGERFESAHGVISWRKSTAVNVPDVQVLPAEYQKVTYEANKKAIRAAIKAGQDVPGATLEEKINLTVR